MAIGRRHSGLSVFFKHPFPGGVDGAAIVQIFLVQLFGEPVVERR